jgi:oligo-1,6-glucosidase
MAKLRNENLVLVYGSYELLLPDHDQIYAYTRTLGDEKLLILLNFSKQQAKATLPKRFEISEVMINNYEKTPFGRIDTVELEPYQAVILKIDD